MEGAREREWREGGREGEGGRGKIKGEDMGRRRGKREWDMEGRELEKRGGNMGIKHI